MTRRAVAASIIWALVGAPALGQNHPFGSHPQAYAAGSITPSHVGQTAQDQAVRDFYDAWKARYLKQTCGAGRFVVEARVSGGNLTVSEAHGYGMLLAALMAGHDPDARTIFDGMFTFFREHPSVFTPYLMAWNQKRSCGDAQGGDSATDGDLDIAYALLLADKQWGSCGPIDYAAEAANVLAAIDVGEVDGGDRYLRLGDWTAPSEPQYYNATRSSDFMPGHLRAFAAASGDAVWGDVLDHTYGVVDAIQVAHSPATGLLPDFIADPAGTPAPVGAGFLEGPNDGAYDYNACRDPWRIATDFLVSGEPRAKTAVQRITTWARSATGNDPANIKSGYQLNGTLSPGADYRSMAFVAPLGVGAMTDASNQAWLNAIWDLVAVTPIEDEGYYENTLKLLGMLVMSGNWWTPEAVGGGCVALPSTPLCSGGGALGSLQLKLGGLTAGPGAQSLSLKGSLFFPGGLPVAAPYASGAQLLIQDAGNANATIYEISRFTTAVPSQAAGSCDAGDGWDSGRFMYRNRSGALDPPMCTAGSANGLNQIRYRPRDANTLDLQVKSRGANIAAPVGPLRLTWVLGPGQPASDSGQCATSVALPCTANGSGSTRKCR
ncbi:MAG: glycosyl hydrolase family 8 [Deltaproteobacteria bacterium]|nr:glycosyl hydrolase family 8 [Deltaproteobacteria bacterium]